MSSEPAEDLLVEIARTRGIALDPARAAAIRPLCESLLARLVRLSDLLPRDRTPPPSGPGGEGGT